MKYKVQLEEKYDCHSIIFSIILFWYWIFKLSIKDIFWKITIMRPKVVLRKYDVGLNYLKMLIIMVSYVFT